METAKTKKRIVVIDDDEKHLLAAKDLLEDEGYEVVIHQNGFGATNLVKELQPDLVLLDMNMPALSGERLSKLLLTNAGIKNLPILFYSSNDEDSLRKAVVDYGVAGYICKGDIFNLRKQVARYLDLP